MPAYRRPPTLTLRILLWRHRVVLAVLAGVLLALALARQAAPPPQPTVEVVVTARQATAGTPLTARELTTADLPRAAVPDGALTSLPAALDRQVRVDLPAGMPLVEALLLGDRFDVAAPAGTVVVAVRVESGAADLLLPGDRVDLVGPSGSGRAGSLHPEEVPDGDTLARGALVLDVVRPESGDVLGLGGGSTANGSSVTVVAVTPDEGRALAAAASRSALGVVIVS